MSAPCAPCLAAPAKRDSTSTPGSRAGCAATYSFATRFMPSRKGGDEPDAGEAEDAGQGAAREAAVDVAQRRPVELRVLGVDGAGEPLQLVSDVHVLRYVGTGGRSELHEAHASPVLRVRLQETREGAESFRQPFRVVEAVDTDDREAVAQHLRHAARVGLGLVRGGEARELRRIDTDGEYGGVHLTAERAGAAGRIGASPRLARDVLEEAAAVGLGLEAEYVVGEEGAHEQVVHGQRSEHFRGGKGDVQEEPHRLPCAHAAQLLAESDQVVVVYPQQVVGLEQRVEGMGEALVDPDAALVVVAVEAGKVDAVVKERPQGAVREAVVVLLVVLARQVRGSRGEAAAIDLPGGDAGVVGDLAAPPEPQPARLLEGVEQCHRESACAQSFLRCGDAVAHHHQPAARVVHVRVRCSLPRARSGASPR